MTQDSRVIIRLAVGGYLVYLAYQLASSQLKGEGLHPLLAWPAILVFTAAGVYFCVHSISQYIKGTKTTPAPEEEISSSQEQEREADL